MDISHTTNQPLKTFTRDPSGSTQESLREAFYKHEMMLGKYHFTPWNEKPPLDKDLPDLFEKRQVKFIGRRVIDFMLAGKGDFSDDDKKLAVNARKGNVKLTKDLEELYNKVTRPVVKVVMVDGLQTQTLLVQQLDDK